MNWLNITELTYPCHENFKESDNISVCYSLCGEKADETKSLYICKSLFQLQTSKATYLRPKLALQILLLLAGDIEICPGPERSLRELGSLLSLRGMHIFHQNVRSLM